MMRELTHAVLAACLMMTGSLLSQALTPTLKMTQQIGEPRFAVMVPAQLGTWASVDADLSGIVDPQSRQPGRKFNTEVLKRVYARPQGDRVMLLAAYAPDLGPTLHAYRPPVLYAAQGWVVRGQRSDDLDLPAGRLPVHRLEAARDTRQREAVTYWQLVGTQASRGALHGQLIKFGYSSDNIDPDGLILRVSSPIDVKSGTDSSPVASASALHDDFIRALLDQLKPEAHERLSGLAVLPTPNPHPMP
jgi:EpsI family protein